MRPVRVSSDGRTAIPQQISGKELVIGSADTGAGVPAELREKIFYPFFTTKQDGSGIGLAAAQKIVASHGGIIDVGGEEGGGATFRVRLQGDRLTLAAEPDGQGFPECARQAFRLVVHGGTLTDARLDGQPVSMASDGPLPIPNCGQAFVLEATLAGV